MKHIVVPVLVVALFTTACSAGTPGSAKPSPSGAAAVELVAQVASYDLAVGEQRFIVGLLTKDQRLIGNGKVQLQFGYLGEKGEGKATMGERVSAGFIPIPVEDGPAPAVKPDPEILSGSKITGVYSAQASFDRPGFWGVLVTALLNGQQLSASSTFEVAAKNKVAAVGEDAPRSENLTLASTDAPKKAIDSRADDAGQVPDPELHKATIAQSIAAGRPVLVAISTPVYCVSRFCGPITDMVAGLAAKYSDRADFAHIEVWREFENKVINKAAAEWIFKGDDITEPWVFLVGSDGKILKRWDNVATLGEIEPVLQALRKP